MTVFKHLQSIASLTSTASGTATGFAAQGSGTRWALEKCIISYVNTNVGATLNFAETYSAGTDVGVWYYRVPFASAGIGVVELDMGEPGYIAAATNSRLVCYMGGADATVNVAFIGHVQ